MELAVIDPIVTKVEDYYKSKLENIKNDTIDPAEPASKGKCSLISVGWVHNHPEIRTAEQARAASEYKTLPLIDQSGKVGIGPLSDTLHVQADLIYDEIYRIKFKHQMPHKFTMRHLILYSNLISNPG